MVVTSLVHRVALLAGFHLYLDTVCVPNSGTLWLNILSPCSMSSRVTAAEGVLSAVRFPCISPLSPPSILVQDLALSDHGCASTDGAGWRLSKAISVQTQDKEALPPPQTRAHIQRRNDGMNSLRSFAFQNHISPIQPLSS